MRRYAEALPFMISGNLEWSYLTPQHTIYIHTDSAGA